MGMAIVKIKMMPASPEVDFEAIKKHAQEIVENAGGKGPKIEEEPIAFGLKAVIIFFGWEEDKEVDSLENSLKEIEGVNSAEVIDIRRAIG